MILRESHEPSTRGGVPRNIKRLKEKIQVGDGVKTLGAFISTFDTIGNLFNCERAIEKVTRAVIRDAAAQHTRYLELRFSPLYMARAGGLHPDAVVRSVLRATAAAARAYPSTQVRLLLIVERQMPISSAWLVEQLAERYRKQGVVGLDLANDEASFPPDPFAGVFYRARQAGLKVTIHAGEVNIPKNIATAIKALGASRIGHGFFAFKDPEVMALLKDRGVLLEQCPTSSCDTGSCASLEAHTFPEYLRSGLRTTICTDDPGVSNISLTSELAAAIETYNLSLEEIKRLLLSAAQGAFVEGGEKIRLIARINAEFNALVEEFQERGAIIDDERVPHIFRTFAPPAASSTA